MVKRNALLAVMLAFGLVSCGRPIKDDTNIDEPNIEDPKDEYILVQYVSNHGVEVNFFNDITKVKEGDTVSFEILPVDGTFKVTSVTVYGEEILPKEGSYSFVAKNSDAIINITLSKVVYPSLRTVMSNVINGRNYTYRLEDKIFNSQTTFYFTENAYYYTYSKDNSDLGYASDSNGKVFEFHIDENGIVPGEFAKNNNGEVITRLWEDAIVSFEDFRLDTLSNEANENNIYQIEDDANKTLFAAFAGYADIYALPYVTVSVEVTGVNTFISTVHFEPENEKYTGDCVGYIEKIGSTEIPYIEEFVANGGSAKVDEAALLVDLLGKIKNSNNYKITVTKENEVTYEDYFTDTYFYSDNKKSSSKSKGNIVLGNNIYNFNISNDSVVLGNEITYSSSNHNNLWENSSNSFKNMSNINLSDFKLTKNDDEKFVLQNAYSPMMTLYYLTHPTSAFPSIDSANDMIIFDKYDENSVTYHYLENSGASTSVTIDSIGTTSIPAVESFIEESNDYDPTDLSALKNVFASLKESRNYSINFTNTFSFGILSTNAYDITFAENSYHSVCTNNESLEFSYVLKDGKVVKIKKDNQLNDVEEETDKTELWGSGLFTSFLDYDETTLTGSKNFDGTYEIENQEFLKLLGKIVYIESENLTTYFSKMSVKLDENSKKVTINAKSQYYGGFTFTINY